MTVVVTGTVVDVTGRKDSREWRAWSPVYREGTGGAVVTYREQDVQVVAGSLTARLEPGPCFVQNPDGDRWLVTVPDADTELWPLIAAAVAIPPGTPVDELNAAVAAYFDANPIPTGPEGPPNVLEIGTVVSGATAGATITGTSPAQVLNLTLPKGDTGDTGPTADWSTISGKPAVVAAGADAAAARGVISAQAADSDLTAIAGLSPANDDVVQRKSGAWTNRTPAQLKTDLALVKGDVGLGNADNTSDANKPISTATQTALNTKQATSEKNQANGYAGLDSGGLVPAALLPSYVVLEYANTGAFPATGEAGKIYTATSTGKIYRWGGSAYAEISPSPGSTDAVPEGATNLYYTSTRADARIAAALGASVQAYSSVLAALAGKTSPSGQLVGTTDAQTLTNKTINGSNNTLTNIGIGSLAASGTANAGTFLRGDGSWAAPAAIAPEYGLVSALPTAGAAGKLYHATDCDAVFRDNGTSWDRIRFGVGGTNQPAPATSGWTTLGSGGTVTLGADRDGRRIQVASEGAINLHGEYRTLSPTSNYTITAYFEFQSNLSNEAVCGILLRNSSSGNLIMFGPGWHSGDMNGRGVALKKYNSPTSYNSNYGFHTSTMIGGAPNWFRIDDNGTNRNYSWSFNGIDWTIMYSTSRTDFITPDQFGYVIFDSSSGSSKSTVRLRSVSVA